MHKLSRAEVKKFLNRCLISGKVVSSSHARKQMADRQFDIQDVEHVMRHGEIMYISYDEAHGNYKAEVEGEDTEGHGLTLELALVIEDVRTVIITGFSPRHKKG